MLLAWYALLMQALWFVNHHLCQWNMVILLKMFYLINQNEWKPGFVTWLKQLITWGLYLNLQVSYFNCTLWLRSNFLEGKVWKYASYVSFSLSWSRVWWFIKQSAMLVFLILHPPWIWRLKMYFMFNLQPNSFTLSSQLNGEEGRVVRNRNCPLKFPDTWTKCQAFIPDPGFWACHPIVKW